jgi:uncharacterized protein YjiS (DUF1127 family)
MRCTHTKGNDMDLSEIRAITAVGAGAELDPAAVDHLEIDRRARRARAESTAWLLQELRAALRHLWARVNAGLLAARTRHELYALSDHTLKDIGLRRTDIGCLVR